MNRTVKALMLTSVIGACSVIWLTYGHSDLVETSDLVQVDREEVIEARKINETLFHQPVVKDHSSTLHTNSLRGTALAHQFQTDETSHLVPDAAIRDMFEYFLSTLGESDLETIIGLIQSEIHSQLSEPARSQALSLLKRYIDYKIDIDELQPSMNDLNVDATMIERLSAMQVELKMFRERYFDRDEYAAFFKLEEAQNTFLIEQLRISADESLTPSEKKQRLDMASLVLPEDARQTRERAQRHIEVSEQVRMMKANNATEGEIFKAREIAVGASGATELALLDKQREEWQQRLTVFSAERSAVLSSGLSSRDIEESITELLAYHFTGPELKRVSALMNDGRL